jgi:hypothetical protein
VDNRDELYRNWLDWVITNLGRDQRLASLAAAAATDAVEHDKGFNAAVKAATAAWSEAVKPAAAREPWGETAAVPAKWERLAFIAWIPLTTAWLWPIVTIALKEAETDFLGTDSFVFQLQLDVALLGVVAFPALALGAVAISHSARANMKRTRHRGGSVAMAALILSYITLIGSPILMLGFLIAGTDFTMPFGA